MSYAEALFLVLLTAIVSVTVTSLVRRALGLDARRQHHEVGNPVYLQIGVVFAVLLAFVFNEVFGEYNAAAQAINGECGALHGAALLAHQLPDRHGRGVEEAILNYSKVVISDEWPALQHREASPNAVVAFQAIIEAAGNLNVGQPNDPAIQGQILALLSQAHAFRETRIFPGKPRFANYYLASSIVLWSCLSRVCTVCGCRVANRAFLFHGSFHDVSSFGLYPSQNARLPL